MKHYHILTYIDGELPRYLCSVPYQDEIESYLNNLAFYKNEDGIYEENREDMAEYLNYIQTKYKYAPKEMPRRFAIVIENIVKLEEWK